MPQTKSLLKKCIVETAVRRRSCKYSRRPIAMGSRCIVVFDGPRDRFCYSRTVGLRMIAAARERLAEMEQSLTD